MTKMCWKCERMIRGENWPQPDSWKMMVTMSLPMCLFLSNCKEGGREGVGRRVN